MDRNDEINKRPRAESGDAMASFERLKKSFFFQWLCNNKAIPLLLAFSLGNFVFLVYLYVLVLGTNPTCLPPASQCSLYIVSCPKSWVGYEGRCYYFSSIEGTWDFGQMQCFLHGASLASIDTQEDMDFIIRHKTSMDHWFGLRIQKEGQPWKWTNGTIFSNQFKIRGSGFCAYLDDDGASSARCDTPRNWVCTKSPHSDGWEKFQGLPTNTSSLVHGYQVTRKNCSVPEYRLKEGGR